MNICSNRQHTDDHGAMSDYQELRSPTDLAAYVTCIWTRAAEVDDHASTRVLPDGCIDIVWIGDAHPAVAGPATRAFVSTLPPKATAAGVRFRPGAAPALLGVPADELLDAHIPLGDVWAGEWRAANRLNRETPLGTRIAALTDLLVLRLPRARPLDKLVLAAAGRLERRPGESVRDLSRWLGVSDRHLLRRFSAAVGYGPKTFQRVGRLHRLLALADGPHGNALPLAALAAMAGYADQAHMTREVGRLAGVPPSVLLATRRGSSESEILTTVA
jgi:AraC-like DNA-binding protein